MPVEFSIELMTLSSGQIVTQFSTQRRRRRGCCCCVCDIVGKDCIVCTDIFRGTKGPLQPSFPSVVLV